MKMLHSFLSRSIARAALLRGASLLLLLCLCLATAHAQSGRRTFSLPLSDDSTAVLEVYLPPTDSASGRAVVCLPGGSYAALSMDTEGRQWAPFFLARGIAFAVLQYRLPAGDWHAPLTDAFTAINTLRAYAPYCNINPDDVGIMGFSAGGHLASVEVTHADSATLPNFQILIYPVITMEAGSTHATSAENFLGKSKDDASLVNFFSSDKQVKAGKTPPAFIALCGDDSVVKPVENGLAYYAALQKVGGKAELHVYPNGGHGWGFRPSFPHHDELLNDLSNWLRQLGR